jgi:hypothetical protein
VLFDLRSPARRRGIKVVYSLLAVLMAVGLVGFGIGGATSGGAFDVSNGCGGSSADTSFEKEVSAAEKRTVQQPANPAAWAALTRARYQAAASGADPNTGTFSQDGVKKLPGVAVAWKRYLVLAQDKADPRLAGLAVETFVQLNRPADAAKAQQIVTDANPTPEGFYQLAVFSYAAKQARTGDLAAQRAIELSPKDMRASLKDRLKAAKQQAAQGATGGGTQPPAGTSTSPSG